MKKKALALMCALLLLAVCAAESLGRELSGYYGQDIAQAAEALGGLSYSAGEEYAENYVGEAFSLRGNDGKVTFIELRDYPGQDALCGVCIGMARGDVEALMAGCPMLWQYDEELAYTVREDAEDPLNSETLVVFFDEGGKVNGARYRSSGVE